MDTEKNLSFAEQTALVLEEMREQDHAWTEVARKVDYQKYAYLERAIENYREMRMCITAYTENEAMREKYDYADYMTWGYLVRVIDLCQIHYDDEQAAAERERKPRRVREAAVLRLWKNGYQEEDIADRLSITTEKVFGIKVDICAYMAGYINGVGRGADILSHPIRVEDFTQWVPKEPQN